MFPGILKESRFGLEEDRVATAVFFGEDDLVEEHYGGVVRPGRLAFVKELVEGLRLLEHHDVLGILARQTFKEVVHLKLVECASLPLGGCGGMHILAIGVEETGEAAHKSGLHLVGMEGGRAYDADLFGASSMGVDLTSRTLVHTLVSFLITHRAHGRAVQGEPGQTMPFHPADTATTLHRMHK